MNEFGEPNMGNPSVRFDEGRERVGHWPRAFQSILSRLLYPDPKTESKKIRAKKCGLRTRDAEFLTTDEHGPAKPQPKRGRGRRRERRLRERGRKFARTATCLKSL